MLLKNSFVSVLSKLIYGYLILAPTLSTFTFKPNKKYLKLNLKF